MRALPVYYISVSYRHKVFLIRFGLSTPYAANDVKDLYYFPIYALDQLDTPSVLPPPFDQSLAHSTVDILKSYQNWRNDHIELVNMLATVY